MAAQKLEHELKRGSAELLVLALLEERQRHGYEIGQVIASRSEGAISFHVTSLYPTLYRLEDRGLIEGPWVEGTGQRRPRAAGGGGVGGAGAPPAPLLQADAPRPADAREPAQRVGELLRRAEPR